MKADETGSIKYAAVDIGSNAVRLLLMRVYRRKKQPLYKKESLIRVPLRLGEDAFSRGRLSKATRSQLMLVMMGFASLLKAFKPKKYLVYATSAMRDLKDAPMITREILKHSGLHVEVISGRKEAEIVCANHIEDTLGKKDRWLYADVGGGSTELTLIASGKIAEAKSFNIGTVRILMGLDVRKEQSEIADWLEAKVHGFENVRLAGSGGNINTLFKLAELHNEEMLTRKKLEKLIMRLEQSDFEEKLSRWGLKTDRAQVIVPAGKIYLQVMQHAGIEGIHAPQIGLADGMIHRMHEKQ